MPRATAVPAGSLGRRSGGLFSGFFPDSEMNQRDLPIGAALLLLALWVLWHVQSYPPSPGQPYNAALFPGIAATGLAIAAVLLMAQALRRRRDPGAPPASPGPDRTETDGTDAPAGGSDGGATRWLSIGLTIGAIVFYLAVANWLGFVLTGIVLLATLMWAYGVRPAVLVPVSILATLVIHASFYKLLKVPLPWGILQPIAW